MPARTKPTAANWAAPANTTTLITEASITEKPAWRAASPKTTPPDHNERWWVWKCPTKGCDGLLHVAGYARDLHALYVTCDGVCGKTFLR